MGAPVKRSPSDFLAEKGRQARLARSREPRQPLEAWEERCASLPPSPSLTAALRGGGTVAVVAEFKRRSPSAGELAQGEDPAEVARAYRSAGARAVSVLTDGPHFRGSLADLARVAEALPGLPLLRKDFLVDPVQVFEARAAGASGVLLIVGLLEPAELAGLLEATTRAGLEALVEVHTEDEWRQALDAGATLVGINNRDLRSLTTDLAVTERLAPLAPPGVTVVSESGIRSAADVRRVRDAGAHAVLVGESLLRRTGVSRLALLEELAGVPRREAAPWPSFLPLPRRGEGIPVKICGLTRPEDAALAVRWGASALGVVFAPSPRRVGLEQAREILSVAPAEVARVGVFVNPDPGFVAEAVEACSLGWIQLSGTEGPADVLQLSERLAGLAFPGRRVGVLKAVPMGRLPSLEEWGAFPADAFLLDSPAPGQGAGGTGRTFDWDLARDLPWPRTRVALAGGLSPENLPLAVARVGPALVDVSSGVEARPGVKDPERLRRFLETARSLPVSATAQP